VERITSEKELWENKYEQKRRALKEIELSYTRANADLEKRAAALHSQVDSLTQERKAMEDAHAD
jgi:hypothetical protein